MRLALYRLSHRGDERVKLVENGHNDSELEMFENEPFF